MESIFSDSLDFIRSQCPFSCEWKQEADLKKKNKNTEATVKLAAAKNGSPDAAVAVVFQELGGIFC